MAKYLKLYEDFETHESLDTRVRSKIIIQLKKHGLEYGVDYEYAGGEFLANDMETAQAMADAVAGKFRVVIYDQRPTKDGQIPLMIVENFEKTENQEILKTQRQGRKPVNLLIGRFQPFHLGHLKAAEELYKINNLPVVVVSVRGSGKAGKGTTFSEELTDKIIKTAIANEKFLEDHVKIKHVAFDTQLFPALRPQYEPVLLGSGEDRYQSYQRQLKSFLDKGNPLGFRDDFKIKLTQRYASGTEVRQAIQRNDQKEFQKLMPSYLHSFWLQLASELNEEENQDFEIQDQDFETQKKDENKAFRQIDAIKKDIENVKDAIEKIRQSILNAPQNSCTFEDLKNLVKKHQDLLIEMKNSLEALKSQKDEKLPLESLNQTSSNLNFKSQ